MRDIRKKSSFLTLAIAFVFVVAFSFHAAAQENDNAQGNPMTELIRQRPALEAYSILRTTFAEGIDGSVSYPDDFAGAWIDNFKLHIALTSLSDEGMESYKALLADFESHIVFVEADFSLNVLDELRYNIAPILEESIDIYSHYIDVVLNGIEFEISESDYASNECLIEHQVDTLSNFSVGYEDLGLFERLISFIPGEEMVPEFAPLRGGMRIQHRNDAGSLFNRTLGMSGTILDSNRNPVHQGIVTAAHGLSISGNAQIVLRNGAEFGRVNVRHHGSNGDWALVRLTNSDILTNRIFGTSTSATRNIVGTLNDLPRGAAAMRFGQTSGFSRVEVTAQNVTSGSTGGLTRAILTQGTSAGGDSGGPYYVLAPGGGNNYLFVGVHTSSNVGNGGNTVSFTPYTRFMHRFIVRTHP